MYKKSGNINMRKNYCQSCSFARAGVKTRKYIPHTCGLDGMPIRAKRQYIPTREELDKYIARLKELMQEDENPQTIDKKEDT